MTNPDKTAANFERTYPVRALRVFAALLEDILSQFFGGYMMIHSEALNGMYVRVTHRVQELAGPYQEVATAFSEFLSWYPNLYEVGDDIDWEFGQDVVRQLRARVSELYVQTVPLEEGFVRAEILLKEDGSLYEAVVEVKDNYVAEKRQYEQRWEKRVSAAGEEFQKQTGLPRKVPNGAATDERLYDEAHAACVEALMRKLRDDGQRPETEGTYNVYGERGSVDVYVSSQDSLAIYEVWTRLNNLNEALRKLDEKARVFPTVIAQRSSVTPTIVTAHLVLLATSQNCEAVKSHAHTFESRFAASALRQGKTTAFFKLELFDPVQSGLAELLPASAESGKDWRLELSKWARFPNIKSFVQAWNRKSKP